jgi:hypothetical protein
MSCRRKKEHVRNVRRRRKKSFEKKREKWRHLAVGRPS